MNKLYNLSSYNKMGGLMLEENKKKSYLKIILPVVVITIIIVILAIHGIRNDYKQLSSESTVSNELGQENLKLTDEMLKEIKDVVEYRYYDTVMIITAREVYENYGFKVTNFVVTSKKKTNNYTYSVYGTLYYEDKISKNKYTDEMRIDYYAVVDKTEEKGYKIMKEIIPLE